MDQPRHHNVEFSAMGSPCLLSFFAEDTADVDRIAAIAIDEIRRIERRYSRYRQDSFLSQINSVAETAGSIEVDPETADLLDHAYFAYAKSDGLFDVTSGLLRRVWNDATSELPGEADVSALLARVGLEKVEWRRSRLTFTRPGMELDFGGIGKEYAADRSAEALRSNGIAHGLVDLGGDIALVGPHPDGSPWRIGVRDPAGKAEALATLFISHGGVATSGSYERFWNIAGRQFCHVLNPRTGWPVDGLPSVTVVEETCLAAGVTSTIALLKGDGGAEWLGAVGAAHLYVDRSWSLGGSISLRRQRASYN
ncbi:MAG: FAD:protein FMN transferase [Bradyrhizobium sp.]|nr:MAG: FAD:protein FMN transferase [Bradyrhizobium sp.]